MACKHHITFNYLKKTKAISPAALLFLMYLLFEHILFLLFL